MDVDLEGTAHDDATTFDVTAEGLGSGTCTRTGARFTCTEVLPGVPIDRDAASDIMRRAGRPAEEIAARLRVTDVFGTDPIGILTFDASGR